jgi:hypothetical protein
MKDTKQAIRTKSTNWKAIAEIERDKRIEIQKRLTGMQGYQRHLEDECCQLEKDKESLLSKIQKSENFSDDAARIIKQHEFKSNILDKENARLKQIINAKNSQINDDEERIHKLSEASKGLFEELQLSREHIKQLEINIYKMEQEHKLSLKKAGSIVDDYFKYKFLDSGIRDAEVVLDSQFGTLGKQEMNISILDSLPMFDDDELKPEVIESFAPIASKPDDDFENQLKFLENINL